MNFVSASLLNISNDSKRRKWENTSRLRRFFLLSESLAKWFMGVYVVMEFDVMSIVTTKLTEFCAVIQNLDVMLDITTNMW